MSESEISSDESESSTGSNACIKKIINNSNKFLQLIKLCQKNTLFPQKYVDEMHIMYLKCSNEQKISETLCSLILKGIKHISPTNKDSFQYVVSVYNELLQLSKRDLTDIQTDDCVPSTSNASIITKLENNYEMNKSYELFKLFIEKCYQNEKFPKSNIEVVNNLYKTLPSEFVDSKYFIKMLKEANQAIWPDSSVSLYVHVEYIYNQLLQFETSMKIQNRKISTESQKMNEKNSRKFKKLKIALTIVRKKIKMLDEKEMDINDDDEFDSNSAYILKDKFEKRALDIYKRMCKLKDEPDFLEEPPLRFKETKNHLVNKTIQKYYNSRKVFPDYFEIYTLLEILNNKKKLNWSETELKNISQDAFLKLGKQLKIQRLNEYFGRLSNVIIEKDPAEENPELKQKLDESRKKLFADLDAVTEKFQNIQEYAEETEGSCLNNTDCEISSEDECSSDSQDLNIVSENINIIPAKRKTLLSNKTDSDESKKKIKKINHIDTVNVTSCSNMLEKHNDEIKNVIPTTVTEIMNKIDKNLENNNSIEEKLCDDTEDNGVIVIDEYKNVDNNINGTVPQKSQENEIENINISTNTNSNFNHNIFEPQVIIDENEPSIKDNIEVNETDSDVEIISDLPVVPVMNKKSLETIIKSLDFNKKYKWDQQPISRSGPSNAMPPGGLSQQKTNYNHTNRWIMHNTNNQRPPRVNNMPNNRFHFNSRLPSSMNHRMPPTVQKSTTQTEKQIITKRYMNTVQQRRNYTDNSQSVLQQQVTTMTTTTTFRQLLQQSSQSGHQTNDSLKNKLDHPVHYKNNKPELIELD